MAANFWRSSHCNRWLFDVSADATCAKDRPDYAHFTRGELDLVDEVFYRILQRAARELSLRQSVAATAFVYYKRFYLSNCFADFDPALVATAALYLACKVEECVEKVVRVITKVRHAQPATVYSRRRVFPAALVLRCEGAILNVLRFDLVVHHPYRPLQQFAEDSGAPDAVFKMAWKIVNDSFCTLAPLVFPPFMVALGALTLAAAHCQWDASRWLAGLNVNPQELADVRGVLYAYYVAILDTKRRVAAQTQQAQDAGPGSSDGQAAAASLRDGASGAEMLGPADTLRGHGVDHDDDVARSFGIRDRQDTKTLQEIFARLESLVPPL